MHVIQVYLLVLQNFKVSIGTTQMLDVVCAIAKVQGAYNYYAGVCSYKSVGKL